MTNLLKRLPLLIFLCATAAFAYGQSALKPPAGAKVAIVEFVDLECPMCAHAAPIVKEASEKYNIPLVRHDFPLMQHKWSRKAAIIARYLDTKSTRSNPVGNDFRDYIFANQTNIDPGNLYEIAGKFAAKHNIELPFQIDPTGDLEKKVNEDYALGINLGVTGTPAIWIVGNGVPPHKIDDSTELNDSSKLYQIIENTEQQVEANAPKTTSHHSTRRR